MAEATVIDGKAFAANLRERVATEVSRIKGDHNVTPGLAVVLVFFVIGLGLLLTVHDPKRDVA